KRQTIAADSAWRTLPRPVGLIALSGGRRTSANVRERLLECSWCARPAGVGPARPAPQRLERKPRDEREQHHGYRTGHGPFDAAETPKVVIRKSPVRLAEGGIACDQPDIERR